MLNEEQKAILGNAADLLEDHGHQGTQLLRELIAKLRGAPGGITFGSNTRQFLHEGGDIRIRRGIHSGGNYSMVDVLVHVSLVNGILEDVEHVRIDEHLKTGHPDNLISRALRTLIDRVRKHERWKDRVILPDY